MTKGLLIITLIVMILLMICPVIVTLVISKNEKNKDLFKKIIATVLIIDLIAIIVLLALWIAPIKNKDFALKESTNSQNSKNSSSNSGDETDELSKAGFDEITLDEYLSLINSEDKSIVLVARPTCYYCQQFTPILKQAKEEMNLKINYINTDKFTEDDYKKFSNSLDYLKNTEWGTPLTLIVQNGDSVAENNGYVELSKIKEFFTKNGFGE